MITGRRKKTLPTPEVEDVASATECTGLMPALPQDAAQDEASAALYAIHAAERNESGEQ